MNWTVVFHVEFETEFLELPLEVRENLAAHALRLEMFGPELGRPHVDTLDGSAYNNMKELRFPANDGVWRVAFAFDPERQAVLLVAGDKAGQPQRRFYKRLIKKADERYCRHLLALEGRQR